jgi:hypothetical protein
MFLAKPFIVFALLSLILPGVSACSDCSICDGGTYGSECDDGDCYCYCVDGNIVYVGPCGSGAACFSESATVNVQGKNARVTMKELQVGDEVLTDIGRYQAVYAFGHYHSTKTSKFLSIQTDEGSTVEVSSEHLLFLQGKRNPVSASSVHVGDILSPGSKVKKIGIVTRKGVFAPLTPDGTLMVNGIRASTYAALQDTDEYAEFQGGARFMAQHTGIHLVLTPFRMLCRGGSFAFCQSYNEDGMPYHIANGIRILKWADRQNVTLQMILFLPAFLFFGALMVLEKILFSGFFLRMAIFSMTTAFFLWESKPRLTMLKGKLQ